MKNKLISKMQLKTFWLENLVIASNKGFQQSSKTVFKPHMEIHFTVQKFDDEWRFRIPFSFTLTWDKECNYQYDHISLEMNSEFVFTSETTEDEVRKFVPHVCLANLWGVARGLIMQVTGVFPGGIILLPTVNMVEVVKDALAKTK